MSLEESLEKLGEVISSFLEKKDDKEMDVDGLKYCIVRAVDSGVFAGYLKSLEGKAATVYEARRIWYWEGAASLSELAMKGTKLPDKCKFPCPVNEVLILDVCEVIPCTEKARKSIQKVPEWSA